MGRAQEYRPHTDTWDLREEQEALEHSDEWILARSKVKFYGAYPAGFLGRARIFLCPESIPLLHICGGEVKKYPFAGLGPHDMTVDLDESLKPDFLMDVRELGVETGDKFPEGVLNRGPINPPRVRDITKVSGPPPENQLWPAALIDRPYTEDDAKNYLNGQGPGVFPDLNDLLRRGLSLVEPGGHVGVLDYTWPQPPKGVKCIAAIMVLVGFNNRVRLFSVYERPIKPWRVLTGARGTPKEKDADEEDAEEIAAHGTREPQAKPSPVVGAPPGVVSTYRPATELAGAQGSGAGLAPPGGGLAGNPAADVRGREALDL